MKIICLAENTAACDNIEAEHGLSLYIEALGHKLLFDMGQGELFLRNAERLEVDIAGVDVAVVSHGHYDHGGGLEYFQHVNSKAQIFISKFAFEPHYNASGKYIGLASALANNERLIFVSGEWEISKGISLLDCNSFKAKEPIEHFGLSVKRGEAFTPEDFSHELYMLIEEEGKRVLISGCSHKGIINIMEWFKPDFLIGGFHFKDISSQELLIDKAEKLCRYNCLYYTCHCTGSEQFGVISKVSDRFRYLSSGEEINI